MANEALLAVTVDGVRYELSPSDFTAVDDLAISREVGMTLTQVFRSLMGDDPPLFGLAALVWRYRVGDGERRLTFEQVASKVDFEAFRSIGEAERDEEPAPKASGGS